MIRHIPREENEKANTLAQQASGYNVAKKYFNIRKPMQIKAELLVLDEPVRPVAETDLTAEGGVESSSVGNPNRKVEAKVQDWRMRIIRYIRILVMVRKEIFGVWHLNMS